MWTGLEGTRSFGRMVGRDGDQQRRGAARRKRLARLALRDDEPERLTPEPRRDPRGRLQGPRLDLESAADAASSDVVNVWAEDDPHEPLPLEESFANAPSREDDQYRVPPTATRMEA